MALKINSENLNKKRAIDLSLMERIATSALKQLKKNNCEINLVFVSNQKIRAVNRKYLGMDSSTDVIAFPSEKSFPGISGEDGKLDFIGEIVVSTDKAFSNSGVYDTSFNEETALYIIHGILHFCGYDDTSDRKRTVMRKKENEILRKTRKYLV